MEGAACESYRTKYTLGSVMHLGCESVDVVLLRVNRFRTAALVTPAAQTAVIWKHVLAGVVFCTFLIAVEHESVTTWALSLTL